MNDDHDPYRLIPWLPVARALTDEETEELKKLDARQQRDLAAAKEALAAAKSEEEAVAVILDHCRCIARDLAEWLWLVNSSSPAFLKARDEQIAIMQENNKAFGFQPEGFDEAVAEAVTITFAEAVASLSGAPQEGGHA